MHYPKSLLQSRPRVTRVRSFIQTCNYQSHAVKYTSEGLQVLKIKHCKRSVAFADYSISSSLSLSSQKLSGPNEFFYSIFTVASIHRQVSAVLEDYIFQMPLHLVTAYCQDVVHLKHPLLLAILPAAFQHPTPNEFHSILYFLWRQASKLQRGATEDWLQPQFTFPWN